MSQFKNVSHVVFDLDGLLIDTEKINTQIYEEISKKYNKVFDQKIKEKCVGKKEEDCIKTVIQELQLPVSYEECKKMVNDREKELMLQVELMPGVKELVCHLVKNKIPIALASNSRYDAIEMKTAGHKDILGCFHHIASGDGDPEIRNAKPCPDVYLAAANRFDAKPHPNECLVFEDSPTGVTAACSAGMQVVMIPDPNLNPELTKHATLVLKSMCDFKPECFGLPAFEIKT